MKRLIAALTLFSISAVHARAEAPGAEFWPQWRGPHGTGVAPQADPPVKWSEEKNIRWKIEVPGLGLATPIIWKNLVFIQTAIKTDRAAEGLQPPAGPGPRRGGAGPELNPAPFDALNYLQPDNRRPRGRGRRGRRRPPPTHMYKFCVLAIDRQTGKTVWDKTLCEELPHESIHNDSSQASNSPVTDGKHIYAFFGSRGLYCLDFKGNVKWEKRFGKMKTRNSFGEGSSPVIHDDTIVVNWDHEEGSFIVALDKKTGKERWRADRDEPTSWLTPIIIEDRGKPQVFTSATNMTRSYDLATGKVLWECGGLTANVISTPVADKDLVYAMSSRRGSVVLAIRYQSVTGDITGSESVAWTHEQGTPYVPSPLLYGKMLYFTQHTKGILTCLDAKTGEPHYSQRRLKGVRSVYASPVGAKDRIYLPDRDGKTLVIKKSKELEVLATNTLDDSFDASPAIVGDELYLRGHKFLYCIARE